MTGLSIATSFLSPSLARDSARIRDQIMTASNELASLQVSDIGKKIGGDYTHLAAIDFELSRMQAYKTIADQSNLYAGGVQTALEKIDSEATNLAKSIMGSHGSGLENTRATILAAGSAAFEGAVGALNTQIGGRYLFSGNAFNTAPLPDANRIVEILQAEVAGISDPVDFEAAIDTWFYDPAGFSALYAGGLTGAVTKLSNDLSVDLSVSAVDARIIDTIKDLAKISVMHGGGLSGSPESQVEILISSAGTLIASAQDRIDLSAQFGLVHASVEKIRLGSSADIAILETSKMSISSIDPYDASVKVLDFENQMKTIYEVTGRLAALRLTDYLR